MTFLQRALPVVLLGAAALGLLAGCGGDLTLPNEGEPAHLLVQRGDGQHGTAGAALPDSIVVRVTDSRDRPVSGVAVAFVLQGKAGGSLRPQDTVQTDAAGRAAVLWVLGDAAGAQQLQVRVTGATATLTADLTATAGAGTAATLAAVSGDAQTATAGTPLPDSLVVHVSDADGNPVAGVEVSWTLTGGGAVSAAQTTSGADGRTGVVRTLGPAVGTQTTVATAVGLAGSPVTFTATARAGAAGALSITTQPSATAQSGVAFATAPVVRLLDANGNPVTTSGVAVTATIATGEPGAQLIGQSTRGTTNGVATFSGLGIQGPAGSYTLTFGGADLVGVTSQPITIAGGAAAKLAVVTQPGPSGGVASGVVFPQQPQVRLVDASGNAVSQAGITVTATLTGPNAASGALNGDRTQSTNASGVATFTDLSITGPPANYTILFAATNLVSATSQAVGVGLGSSTTQIGASKSATVVGEPYTVSVAVSGSGSTPTGTVAVSDQKGATCNAALSGGSGSCTLRSTSAGNHELLASYGGDGEHGGSSATLAHTVSRAGTTTTIRGVSTTSGLPGVPVTVEYGVSVNAPGTGTPSGTVTVSGGGGSCTATVAQGQCALSPTTVGGVTFTAHYAGDGNFEASQGTGGSYTVLPPPVVDLTVAKSHSGNFTRGATGSYTIEVSNIGNAATTGTITVVDQLPSGLTYQASSSGWSCSGSTTVTCDRAASIAAGSSATLTLTVQVAADAPASVVNSVTVSGGGESNTSNDTASDPTTIVAPPNQPPTAQDHTYSTSEGAPLTVPAPGLLALAADPDGDALTAVAKDAATANGHVVVRADGSFTYTPAAGFSGSDAFTYQVSDGTATSNAATVTITVNPVVPVNQAPTANDDPATPGDPTYSTTMNVPLTVAAPGVLANDTDPEHDPLTAQSPSQPQHGTVDLHPDGSFIYTPDQDYSGADSFTYRASDGSLASAPATVTIGVQTATP